MHLLRCRSSWVRRLKKCRLYSQKYSFCGGGARDHTPHSGRRVRGGWRSAVNCFDQQLSCEQWAYIHASQGSRHSITHPPTYPLRHHHPPTTTHPPTHLAVLVLWWQWAEVPGVHLVHAQLDLINVFHLQQRGRSRHRHAATSSRCAAGRSALGEGLLWLLVVQHAWLWRRPDMLLPTHTPLTHTHSPW